MYDKNKIILEILAENIKKYRHSQGLSQEQLALKCNFDRTYIGMLERAKRNPSLINLFKLSKGLQIELHQLLDYSKYNNE